MKGLSLVELMIAMLIFSIILGAIYGVMAMGQSSYQTGEIQIVVQQEARKAMNKIVTELREASSVNLGDEYPFTIWTQRIKYEVVNGQLQRIVDGGTTTVLANDVANIQFTLYGGDVVYIILTTQKNTLFGRTLSANLNSQVTLRN
ncbi:MAG: prepilin-type N-terminal cleavage/methylation domain-containing protein [Candidatus Omnitrophica bacterium]|nr:prepilin-type N-terminal cleavage/methylation domain-containing protein [Candidatus Omnitrophota bacterium]